MVLLVCHLLLLMDLVDLCLVWCGVLLYLLVVFVGCIAVGCCLRLFWVIRFDFVFVLRLVFACVFAWVVWFVFFIVGGLVWFLCLFSLFV